MGWGRHTHPHRTLEACAFGGNFKPEDKPIWQIQLSCINEKQKKEALGEKSWNVSREKRSEERARALSQDEVSP